MCGGNVSADLARTRRGRSIPACAGEPYDCPDDLPVERSIPACAGEPSYLFRHLPTPRVYPPRVRGNLVRLGIGNPVDGSIPACAGEPYNTNSTLLGHKVCRGVLNGILYPSPVRQ